MNAQKAKLCQYGKNCYRRNPAHFKDYAHPHLDKIYQKGKHPLTNEYAIPNELSLSADVIEQQLQIFETLFPKNIQVKDKVAAKITNDSVKKANENAKKPNAESKKNQRTTAAAKIDDNSPTVSAKNNTGNNAISLAPGTSTSATAKCDSKTKDEQLSASSVKKAAAATSCASTSAASSSATKASHEKPSEDESVASSQPAKKVKITRNIKDYIPVVLPKGQMAEKLKNSAPYHMFLTAITDAKLTHNEPLTVTLQEIFDESLGEIESTVQINFMVDVAWLLGHYYFAGILGTPLLILYGDETEQLKTISQHQPNVATVKINMPTPFATSHAKVMLLGYKDGSMRVVISTANLYEDDWHNRTQGVWISPKLDAVAEDADTGSGESPTGFRNDLMLYLAEYKIAKLQPWIARIRKSDFGSVNVFFIGSVPGGFREGPRGHSWGHARLGSLLAKHATVIDEKIPVICQSSSIGSLGANVQTWIQQDFLNSLRKDSQPNGLRNMPPFKMIYPSYDNVRNSHDGMLGGGCLPYSKSTNDKQMWLKNYLYQWKAKARFRTQAMPHIKCYTRFNLDSNCVYWFVLTSANLSKAAWGSFNKSSTIQPPLRIANYEAGVVFLPRFVIGEETFPLGSPRDGMPPFPLPYDVPLTQYGPDDTPFFMDYLR